MFTSPATKSNNQILIKCVNSFFVCSYIIADFRLSLALHDQYFCKKIVIIKRNKTAMKSVYLTTFDKEKRCITLLILKLMGEDPRSLTASSVFHDGTWSGLL